MGKTICHCWKCGEEMIDTGLCDECGKCSDCCMCNENSIEEMVEEFCCVGDIIEFRCGETKFVDIVDVVEWMQDGRVAYTGKLFMEYPTGGEILHQDVLRIIEKADGNRERQTDKLNFVPVGAIAKFDGEKHTVLSSLFSQNHKGEWKSWILTDIYGHVEVEDDVEIIGWNRKIFKD